MQSDTPVDSKSAAPSVVLLPATMPQHVGISPTPKPGFTTTEFWTIVFALALIIAWSSLGSMPPELAGILTTFISLGYMYLRGQVKADHNDAFDNILQTILNAGAAIPAAPVISNQSGKVISEEAASEAGRLLGNLANASPRTPIGGFAALRLITWVSLMTWLPLLTSCAWTAAHPRTTVALEQSAVNIGLAAGEAAISGGTLGYIQAIPLGLNSISSVVAGLNQDAAAKKIATTVNDFTAANAPLATTTAIVNAYVQAVPDAAAPTPAQKSAALVAIATGLSNGIAVRASGAQARADVDRGLWIVDRGPETIHDPRSTIHDSRRVSSLGIPPLPLPLWLTNGEILRTPVPRFRVTPPDLRPWPPEYDRPVQPAIWWHWSSEAPFTFAASGAGR